MVTMVAASGRVSDNLVACCGHERNKCLGPGAAASDHDYLTGEYLGDHGWDAASLAVDPSTFAAYREAVLTRARWAGLGTLGSLTLEVVAKYTDVQIDGPVRLEPGAQIFTGSDLDNLDDSNQLHAQAIPAIVACQIVPMGTFKAYRVHGGPLRKGLQLLHPGDTFHALVLVDDPDTVTELRVKEIKHGRLVVASILGYSVQAIATDEGHVILLCVAMRASRESPKKAAKSIAGVVGAAAAAGAAAATLLAGAGIGLRYRREQRQWLPGGDGSKSAAYKQHFVSNEWANSVRGATPQTNNTVAACCEAVLVRIRWDGLGTLGSLTQGVAAKYSDVQADGPGRLKPGAQIFNGIELDSQDDSTRIRAQAIPASVACQIAVMGAFRAYRMRGSPLCKELQLLHPGEAYHALVLTNDPDTIAELQMKEIKHGRLAMASILGYYVQAIPTDESHAGSGPPRVALATLRVCMGKAPIPGPGLAGNPSLTSLPLLSTTCSSTLYVTMGPTCGCVPDNSAARCGPMRGELHLPHAGDVSDPLVLAGNPDTFDGRKVQGIGNDRLTVLYMSQHHVQAGATDEGPDEGWDPRIALVTLTHVKCAHVATTVKDTDEARIAATTPTRRQGNTPAPGAARTAPPIGPETARPRAAIDGARKVQKNPAAEPPRVTMGMPHPGLPKSNSMVSPPFLPRDAAKRDDSGPVRHVFVKAATGRTMTVRIHSWHDPISTIEAHMRHR